MPNKAFRGPYQAPGRTRSMPNSSKGSPPVSAGDVFVARFGQLKRVVAGMGLGAADAEDILQDVFVQAAKSRTEFGNPDEAMRWLIRVTINRGCQEFRHRQRFRKAAGVVEQRLRAARPLAESPAEAVAAAEDLDILRRALGELDESLLAPLVLHYFCGLDSQQVSEILQVPAASVRGRWREARLILAQRLRDRGVGP